MQSIKLKQLNKLNVLKRIDRSLLRRFLDRFAAHFEANGLTLPPPDSSDGDFYACAARLLRHPERLCPELNDALLSIDELATPAGIATLSAKPDWERVFPATQPASDRSPADLVLELWLARPDLIHTTWNTWRLKRLSAFEYASSGLPPQKRPPFDPDDKLAVLNFTSALDAWFLRHQRGDDTTRVEVYPMDGEYWYLIRHGGLFTRAPRVDRQATHILQFRPERDDVLVYSPDLDEVRVNARTKGERELYIGQFGLHLRGHAAYFCERRTYTLQPLRELGAAAPECDAQEGIERITLKAVEVRRNNHLQETVTHEAEDLFQCLPADPRSLSQFISGTLARALFEVQFTGQLKPQAVEIRLPNTLKMGRRCNPGALHTWLTRTGMRLRSDPGRVASLA